MSKVGNQSRIRKQFEAILDQKAGEFIRFRAVQGDGTGTVKVPGKPNYIYIRRLGRNLCEECLNARLPSRNDLPTIVGYTAANPGTLEVLGVDWAAITEPGDYAYAPHHHQAHELGNEDGGDDVVWAQKQQVLPMLCRPTDPVSMFVVVLDDWYPWGSGWNYFEGATSADLTGHIPVLPGEARFVLISIDGATNALQYTSGTEFVIGLPLADIDERVPAPPLGSVPVCAVYIAGTTTSLDWENLYDLRLFNAPVGGSLMPGVHDHSSDTEGGLLPATSVEVEEIGAATYDDLQDWLNTTQSAGRLSGGAVTAHAYPITGVTVGGAGAGEFKIDGDHTAAFTAGIILTVSGSTNNDGDYTVSAGGATFAGGVTTIPVDEAVAAVADGNIAAGTVDVALGTGFIKVADTHLAATKFFDWVAATTPLIPTNNASNWIYADYNAGAPIVGITDDHSIITRNDIFTIDRLWRIDSELHIIGKGMNAYNLGMRTHRNLVKVFHFQRGDGLALTESGLRKVDVTAGNMYRGLNEIPTSHIDTDDGDSFTTLYRDGGGGWTWVTGQTAIDNVNYDDGSGVLDPIVNNQYGVYWAYLDYDSHLFVQYGQDSYHLGEAEAAQPPATAPFLASFSMLIAKIVVKEGAAENFYSVEYPWDTVFVGAQVAVHNNLGGLQGGVADERYHLTAAEHSAIVGGSGAANRIAYWTAADTLAGDAGLTYNPATDTLVVAGMIAAGSAGAASTTRIIDADGIVTEFGGSAFGIVSDPSVQISTVWLSGVFARAETEAAVITLTHAIALRAGNAIKGAGSTIATAYGLYVDAITAGTANYAIYAAGGDSYHAGQFTLANNLILDDGSYNSPSVKFVSGVFDDVIEIFLKDDLWTATRSDLVVKLCDSSRFSQFQIWDSGSNIVAYIDSDGTADFNRLAVGADATFSSTVVVRIREESALTAADIFWGCYSTVKYVPAANFATTVYGFQSTVEVDTNFARTAGSIYGLRGEVIVTNGATATALVVVGFSGFVDVEDASAGTACSTLFATPYVDTGTITLGIGAWVTQGVVGAGSITTLYGLRIDPITAGDTNYAIYSAGGDSHHTGKMSIGGTVAPLAQVHVDQSSASGAIPVLYLDQGDVSEEMIEFVCTIGIGNAIEAAGGKTLTPTHFIKVTLPGTLTRYIPVGTIA